MSGNDPELSLVVIVFSMRREAFRMLQSPAAEVNFGAAQARGKYLGLLIDGARIASPGLIRYARSGLELAHRPVVSALAWNLGPEFHRLSVAGGYDRQVEDWLLEQSDWLRNGYNLFAISSLAGSSMEGYFRAPAESNALFLACSLFDELGGFDARLTSTGGGYVNDDLFVRSCESEGTELVVLLGEGTFHQVHEGASTDATGTLRQERSRLYLDEYRAIGASRLPRRARRRTTSARCQPRRTTR